MAARSRATRSRSSTTGSATRWSWSRLCRRSQRVEGRVEQLSFLEPEPRLPEGFRYQAGLITPAGEAALLERVRELPFREFEFHGFTGKRRVVSFGWRYDFSARHLEKADDIPDF